MSRIIAFLLFVSPAIAQESKVKASDVPKAVLAAVARKYQSAKQVGFSSEPDEKDKKRKIFEVRIVDAGRKIDVEVSPEGKILTKEELISIDALPEAVKTSLAGSAKYARWKVLRAEKVVTNERADSPSYELLVSNGKQRAEVVMDQTGKITSEEPKASMSDAG